MSNIIIQVPDDPRHLKLEAIGKVGEKIKNLQEQKCGLEQKISEMQRNLEDVNRRLQENLSLESKYLKHFGGGEK